MDVSGGPQVSVVLFTDVVESTVQRAELGEGAAEELRRAHDRLLAEAVSGHGGRVVKSTGDGIMAVFPGAAEAVAGAVAVEQAVERQNRRADAVAPLSVRVGVSAGDVVFEGDDAFGAPVIEAARLCDLAEGGQILAAEVVRLLAGDRAAGACTPVGEMQLRGLPAPTAVCEIGWEPAVNPVVPVPGGLASVGGYSFVGRQPELAVLEGAWEAVAVAGQRQGVLVAGEPGIGKTRLISQFTQRAVEQGGVVLYGRGEQELGVPYKPVVEALGGYVRDCPQAELAGQMGSLSGELTRLVPQLGVRVPNLDPPLEAEPETQRYRLFEAVAELLAAASESWPLVLVLDDLQWAGKPTMALLRHLLASDVAMRVLVVGAYRDTEVGPDHPLTGLLAETHRVGGVETVSLGGLGEAEVTELTIEAVGADRVGLVGRVLGVTDGNPFFVSEILHVVAAAEPTSDLDLASLGVPEGAQAMVTARLNQLDPTHQPVLETAAVIGQRFDVPLLGAVVGDDDLTLAALAEAEAAGLVGTRELLGGRQFAHALIRDALYHGLTASARVAHHGEVVAALEALPDRDRRLGELARHATRAVALVGVDQAVHYNRAAGELAAGELAFEEAATHYQTALDLLDEADRTATGRYCDLQIALTESLYRSGLNEEGTAALLAAAATARHLADGDRLAGAILAGQRAGVSQFWLPDLATHISLDREALAALGPEDCSARARLLADHGERLWRVGSYEEAEQAGREALVVARRLGDDDTLRRVLLATYNTLQRADNLEDRIGLWGDELIEASYRADDLEAANRALRFRAYCFMESGDLDRAEADLNEAQRLLDSIRQPEFAFYVASCQSCLAAIRGRLDEAERLVDELMGHAGSTSETAFRIFSGVALGCLWWQQGRLGDLRAAIETLIEDQPEWAERIKVLAALVYAESGHVAAADAILDEFVETHFTNVDPSGLWLLLMTTLAHTAVRAGNTEAAAAIEPAIEPYADRIATPGYFSMGPVATALGSLATAQDHYDDAERHFRSATELCERWDLRSFLAMTRLRWAQMLTRRDRPGDHDQARDLATQALVAAEEIGMQRVADEARDLLDGR